MTCLDLATAGFLFIPIRPYPIANKCLYVFEFFYLVQLRACRNLLYSQFLRVLKGLSFLFRAQYDIIGLLFTNLV